MNMIRKYHLIIFCLICFSLLIVGAESVNAQAQTQPANLDQVSNFIKSLIQVVASLAGLIATGFFVLGGLSYITSTGNPVALEKAKRTLIFASLGLAITIGSFALAGVIGDLASEAFKGSVIF